MSKIACVNVQSRKVAQGNTGIEGWMGQSVALTAQVWQWLSCLKPYAWVTGVWVNSEGKYNQ